MTQLKINTIKTNYGMGIYTAVWWVRALYLVIVPFYMGAIAHMIHGYVKIEWLRKI